ncbi:MAG TPA: HAMP domain-containing protein [Nitrospiria bacterium]|nr:HAMP domain-containing protein [Candidatus Manganitrophaceae bacterium]
MIKYSLKFKMVILFSLIIVVICTALGLTFFIQTKKVLLENFTKRGLILAENTAYNSRYGVFAEDLVILQDLIQGVLQVEDVIYVAISNFSGDMLAQKSKQLPNKFDEGAPDLPQIRKKAFTDRSPSVKSYLAEDGRRLYDILAPVMKSRERPRGFPAELLEEGFEKPRKPESVIQGFIQVGMSPALLNQQIRKVMSISIFVTLMMMAGGVGLVYFVSRHNIRPLETLAMIAQKIERGDLSQSAPVTSKDEIGELTTIFNQMTHSLKARDQQIKERMAQVERAEAERERLLHAIESLDESVVLFDSEDRIVFCNESFRTLNKKIAEFVKPGTLFEDQLRASVQSGLIPESIGNEKEWIEQQLLRHSNPAGSFEVKRADGMVVLVKEQRLSDGDTIRIISDITSQKRTEVELIQAAKMATLGEMATGVAHELNQPLSVIRMATENTIERMDEDNLEPRYLRDKLTRISNQVDRASTIINHMRIFGRKSELTSSKVDLRKVVEDALSLFGEQLRLREIIVEKDLPEVCRKVQGQAVQFEQVVLNLLGNAHDAIESNCQRPGEPRRIGLKVEDTGLEDKIKVLITDSGGGIPDSIIKHVFEPFFTTKDPGKGTGLGLSISYGIICDWGGTIKAENKGNGVCITITLPVMA